MTNLRFVMTVVLLMPPWEAIYRTDSERDQTFAEAVQVCEGLRTWYARWGYETMEVPRTAIDQRVNFILQTIEYALTKATYGTLQNL